MRFVNLLLLTSTKTPLGVELEAGQGQDVADQA
jgi:hypothetical protein